MTQEELQIKISSLLENVGIVIDEDLKNVDENLNFEQRISYLFFIRTTEIFKAISILIATDLDQVIPANILLRSMAEYYILLKSSIDDSSFNSRHIKTSTNEKEKWLDKILSHHASSGFKDDPLHFEQLKENAQKFSEQYDKKLQTTFDLFKERNELWIYLHIYAPASMYVHGNRRSFNIYHASGDLVKPTIERDYRPLLRQCGLSAVQVMLQSFEVFCKLINHQTSAVLNVEQMLTAATKEIVAVMNVEEKIDFQR